MSDPTATIVQDPYIWFVSQSLDPTSSEPVVDAAGISTDPNWFAPWWNLSTNSVFLCTKNQPDSLEWKRFLLFDDGRTYSTPSLSIGTSRVPSSIKETVVTLSVQLTNTLSTNSLLYVEVDNAGDGIFTRVATLQMSGIAASITQSVTFNVPVRSQYRVVADLSNTGTNSITSVAEIAL